MRNAGVDGDARARRVLRALLGLYPPSFRRGLGEDLVETALFRRQESRRRHPIIGGLRFWLTEGARFAFDGLLERVQAWPSISDELRHAWRQLRRAPSQQALAIVTLALGVGATIGVATLADAIVFRPLPFADAHRLYLIHARFGSTELSSNSLPNLRDLQASVKTMSWLAGASDRSPALADEAADAERISVLDVTDGYLPALGARRHAGRPFNERDYAAGAARVAIVSHALWHRRWGGNSSVLGNSVRLNGMPYTIVGVMMPAFRDPEPIESGAATGMWVPARTGDFKDRDDYGFRVLGRLTDAVTAGSAAQELTQAGRRLAAAYPAENRVDGADLDFVMHPLHEMTVAGARERVLLVLGAVVLLLMLACANAANLFLARGVSRSLELAVRSALGATRPRLAFQLFSETLLTAVIAGAVGGLLGIAGVRAFVAAAPAGVPRLHEFGLDLRVFGVAAGLTALTAVMFGVLPALRAAREASAKGSAGARTTESKQGQRLQATLVAVEVAISLVLVTSAALLLGSVRHLLNVPPGFDAANVTAVDVRPPFGARTQEGTRIYHAELLERAAALPGVARAALAYSAPGTPGGAWTRVTPDSGMPSTRGSEPSRAPAYGLSPGPDFFFFNAVSPEFFEVLRIPLHAGRLFERVERGPFEVILNESAARRFFPGVDRPLGRRIALGAPDSIAPMREVVGIVGDVRQRGPVRDPEPQIYLPYWQRDVNRLGLLIQPRAGAIVRSEDIRRMVREVAPDVPVDRIEPVAARYEATSAQTRLLASLLTVFAVVGLLLAAIGTYATVSHAFSRRVKEVAIRLTLGAPASGVFRLVLRRALSVAAIGIAAGLALTFLLSRFLEGQLYGVTTRDPLTTGGAVLGIAASVAIAALGPAIRAARVDPNKVLRQM
ncbi:MAG TPA: ADOP family duplicated permease [Vicinamibacterales bacterium]|nr:ADOP family duplicated permease [Vicinamibacterales bacterium]